MKINSTNSPAFGCGACAQLKRMFKKSPFLPEESDKIIKFAISNRIHNKNMTHGEAASDFYKLLKNNEESRKVFLIG